LIAILYLKETLRETLGSDNWPIQSNFRYKVAKMKKLTQKLSLSAVKIERRHIQVFLTLLILSMLVLGAGAPAMSGGSGGW